MSIIPLNGGDWLLGAGSPKEFGQVADLSEVEEWWPATVPGNIRADLISAKQISDPYFGANLAASNWVDDKDWWYKKTFSYSSLQDQRVLLVLNGVDYRSAILFNGNFLGIHTGMFSAQTYDITHLLSAENTLAVRIWGNQGYPKQNLTFADKIMKQLAKRLVHLDLFPRRMATLRCQMAFGWDFAPQNLGGGIWDSVHLDVSGFARITTLQVTAEAAIEKANVTLDFTVSASQAHQLAAAITIRFPAGKTLGKFEKPLLVSAGESSHTISISLDDYQAWSPWDRGAPSLYEIYLSLQNDETVVHTKRETFGFRQIKLNPRPAAGNNTPAWSLSINGQREFIRGANWVPADFLYGKLEREDYKELIRLAKEANINLLRVWGGGLREKREFYDVCDEEGMLVWQEFPFACAFFDRYPATSEFLALAEQECREIVTALRNHPSVVIWCGGNEFNAGRNKCLVEIMQRVSAELDGSRPFKPSSPSPGDRHNWRVWHGGGNIADYRLETAQMLSEFGLQSLPAMESLEQFLPPSAISTPGPLWEFHSAEINKLKRYAQNAGTVEEFITGTQHVQAIGLQTAIEHQRRRKGSTDGVAFWQFNEPWPAISWSVLDYYRRPKEAYFAVQRAYSPVLVSILYPLAAYTNESKFQGEIWAINDLTIELLDCKLEMLLGTRVVHQQKVDLPADSSRRIGEINFVVSQQGPLTARLWQEDRLLSENSYDLSFRDPGRVSVWGAFLSWIKSLVLKS